jgi:type IV pilus assembly protein PilE
MQATQRGVTLIELMTVIVVVAILASIAVPSYRNYLLRAQRTEATTALLNLQAAQEKFYLQNNRYADQAELTPAPPAGLGLAATTERGFYDVTIALDADQQGYTATAAPVAGAGQSDDSRCTGFSVDDNGMRGATGPGGTTYCWR